MDVDRSNYSFLFEDFKNTLDKCEFCAIDQEMTGISLVDQPQHRAMTLKDVYNQSKKVVERYIAFQFGVAIFTLIDDGIYEVKSFNFNLLQKYGDFSMNADAIHFLSKHEMNFQKWLCGGMPYLDKEKEASLLAQEKLICSEKEENEANEIMSLIEKWYYTTSDDTTLINGLINKMTEKVLIMKIEEKKLPVTIDFHRSRLYGLPTQITLKRLTPDDFKKRSLRKRQRANEELREVLGFREFWKCLTNSKKTIVGHNFSTDLMFMIHMHETKLSSKYDDYKMLTHQLFPSVFDTKTIATHFRKKLSLKETHLLGLFTECYKRNESMDIPITFTSPPGYHCYDRKYLGLQNRAHEAGYDAYMTGIAFILLRKFCHCQDEPHFSKLENIISVFGSYFFMNLAGKDVLISKATYILHFESDIDIQVVRSLLLTEEKAELFKSKKEEAAFDFYLDSKDSKMRDHTFIVKFDDETISEETVESRIELSRKRLAKWLSELSKESESVFPDLKLVEPIA